MRRFSAVLGGAAAAALLSVAGAAASHGTSTGGVHAGSAGVAGCGSGITASYATAYSPSIPGYSVGQVNLASIPSDCHSKSYTIQLTDAAGAPVGSEMVGTLPASGTTANIAISGSPDASLVTGIAVVIS